MEDSEGREEAFKKAVKEAKWRCEALQDCIQTLIIPSSSSNWKTTLLRLLQSELSFLNRLSLLRQNPSSLRYLLLLHMPLYANPTYILHLFYLFLSVFSLPERADHENLHFGA